MTTLISIHLFFQQLTMGSEGKSCPGTLFSVSVSNLVQIHLKLAVL